MSQPTNIEREHYTKLVGRTVTAILWEEVDGRALPVLLLNGWDRDGNAATIAVLAGGDDVIAEPAQQELAQALRRAGYTVIDDASMPRVAHLLANGDYGAALAAVARSGRADGVVFVNAKPVGTQQLNYYGRSSTAYNVQLAVRAYHVGGKRMLGSGWNEQVLFTSMNAADKAREALEPVIDEVESSLGEFRQRRDRG